MAITLCFYTVEFFYRCIFLVAFTALCCYLWPLVQGQAHVAAFVEPRHHPKFRIGYIFVRMFICYQIMSAMSFWCCLAPWYREKLCDTLTETGKMLHENNLKFFICAGSLLGAVREQGVSYLELIPWEHDIDICVYKMTLVFACTKKMGRGCARCC